MDKFVIIAAGGRGERMNEGFPKQFMLLSEKPILMHTISIFHQVIPSVQIILVLPADQFSTWKKLCNMHSFHIPHQLVNGGTERFHSVKNGLERIGNQCLAGIHDGVRPLVSEGTIIRTFDEAEKYGNAIPVVPVRESVRIVENGISHPVKRDALRLIQTPQVFHSSLIKQAYTQQYRHDFTDDATVFESMGGTIHLVEGNQENIKITTRNDLIIAETLIKNQFS
ncbi:MAG: 2-C-methyl-D-erythritol 4-phosphate cytidylyltransferase [Bacteroidetes bacterium]|nr:2-C-methyl-D-erythritol 4-phosphate cytidylyltransferase [Bacteroidota bacterium]